MTKVTIATLLSLSFLTISSAQADITHPISSTILSIDTANAFNMSKYETFSDSTGFEVYIYASRSSDNRFLVLDAQWSPISLFTSTITEEKAHNAGIEFAKSLGYSVTLSDAEEYYYDGAYGYGFTVTEAK